MKQFLTFITEARTTKASQEAKRLGLVGDGHGDWYDRTGKLKAKTVGGELKMFGGGGAAQDDDKQDRTGTIDRGRGIVWESPEGSILDKNPHLKEIARAKGKSAE